MLSTLWDDIRFGLRTLLRNRGFAAIALATLGVGIGASSAMFSVVNAVLLNPLPYPQPDRVVRIWDRWDDSSRGQLSIPEFRDLQAESGFFERIALFGTASVNLALPGAAPQRALTAEVTGEFFPILGIPAALGRSFGPEEDTPEGRRVVVLSHGFWKTWLGGADAVGSAIRIEAEEYRVLGVMPPGFAFPNQRVDLWKPIGLDPTKPGNRGNHSFNGIARMTPEATLEKTRAEADAIAARMQERFPQSYPHDRGFGFDVVPLLDEMVAAVRPALLVLLGAVGFILLIACANVANLLLARASERSKEAAVRAALGAGRLRLIRQHLVESAILATGGGLLGLLLADSALTLLVAIDPGSVPRLEESGIDLTVLGFTLAACFATTLIFGSAPALRLSNSSLPGSMKEGGRGAGRSSDRRTSNLLVVAEVSLAVALLAGAGLLGRSLGKLQEVDPGFRAERVLTTRITLSQERYPDAERRAGFFSQLLRRLEARGEIVSAGAISNPPLSGWQNDQSLKVEGFAPPPGWSPFEQVRAVTPGYFRSMGIPLLNGRAFAVRDGADSPPSAIVSQSLARRYWGDEDALGKRVRFGSQQRWKTVVGIVGDVKHSGLSSQVLPTVYVPHSQRAAATLSVMARTDGDPSALANLIRDEVRALDPQQPVFNLRTMQQILDSSISQPRFNSQLLGLFAAVAALMAAGGIYGVLSHLAGQRRYEFGVRLALGATREHIVRTMMGSGMSFALLGVIVGTGGAFLLGRFLESLLFGIGLADPVTYGAVVVLIAAVALAACYLPARRAARTDPIAALRAQ